MREVLFRAKGKDDGKWVYGWYCRYPFGKWPLKDAIIPSEEAESGCFRFVEVDPATVGRYTGRRDRNGKRIFEGDVVDAVRSGDETWRCVVSDIRKIPAEMCGSNVKSMDIVGNIHDNPELLEEKE